MIIWYAYQHDPEDTDTRTVCASTRKGLMQRMKAEPAGTWSYGKRDLGPINIDAVCHIIESLESGSGLPHNSDGMADTQITFGDAR